MKKILVLLLALTSLNAYAARPIGTLGVVDSVTIGNRQFTGVSTVSSTAVWKTLVCATQTSQYGGCKQPDGNAYSVPPGVKFFPQAVTAVIPLATANKGVVLGYGDTDVGFNSASAPTNPIYYGGLSSGSAAAYLFDLTATGIYNNYIGGFQNSWYVPTGKFIFFNGETGVGRYAIHITGFEQ